jgi:DNA end-binding protein Ku
VARPFWSGQIQISLVSFRVKLYPATEAKSEIRFHEISRKSAERVRHQKVSASDDVPVEKDDIVKGYEYSKGEFIQIDPEEVEHLRIASRHTLEIQQFVDVDDLDPALYEKPYFVLPESETDSEAFAVVRKALQDTRKAGLGKIALGGREHLMAISAPSDPKLAGLMAYTLRYAAELRSAKEYFSSIKSATINPEQLALAKELIQRKAGKFEPSKFTDDYEAALRELIDAKLKHVPLPVEKKPASRGKVVNLMDALRRSVDPSAVKKPPSRAAISRSKERATRHGLTLLKTGTRAADKRRKSA